MAVQLPIAAIEVATCRRAAEVSSWHTTLDGGRSASGSRDEGRDRDPLRPSSARPAECLFPEVDRPRRTGRHDADHDGASTSVFSAQSPLSRWHQTIMTHCSHCAGVQHWYGRSTGSRCDRRVRCNSRQFHRLRGGWQRDGPRRFRSHLRDAATCAFRDINSVVFCSNFAAVRRIPVSAGRFRPYRACT